jgi:Gpi18-like mannosyltransferase
LKYPPPGLFSKLPATCIPLQNPSDLLFPTVVFNSAVWAQCDIIFTSFLLLALYFFITEKNTAAMLAIGLALSFKIQTVFIVLLPLSLWVQGKLSLRDILLIPAVYVLSILPCFFAGRPFLDLLFVYQQQAGEFRSLTQFAPSVYQFFGWAPADIFTKGGIWFTSCLVFLFTAWVWKFRPAITTGFMIHTATLSSLLIPYFLPRMHERYFFLADVLCLLYAFYRPGRYYVPILTGLSSLFCYFYFLFSTYLVFPFKVMSIMMLVSLIIVARDFAREHILPTFNVQHDSYR